MIGVVVGPSDRAVITEFFELFKTPWEFYELGRDYEALLCVANEEYSAEDAGTVLLYSSCELLSDELSHIEIAGRHEGRLLSFQEAALPIYGKCLIFRNGDGTGCLHDNDSRNPALCSYPSQSGSVLRIGYDLCAEVRRLLDVGQPVAFAEIPALELHIALLRYLIISAGVTLLEIPPVPEGFRFIVCLTHDVDHASIRKHKFGRTMVGFLYRAVVGSVNNFLRGSIPFRDLWTNWATVLRLPLVYLGLGKDFWQDFVSRYRNLEQGLPSTYFVVPFASRPGRGARGAAPAHRAVRYDAEDILGQIADARAGGCEVGLHGIDAWTDSVKGREELEKIREISGSAKIGSRMHWLYFDENAPSTLEKAGIDYDSTVGYRETVGFRAGTTQVYKPLRAERLLELPMHVMDTALFYPSYLGLSTRDAAKVLEGLADKAERYGGCLTVNWHDRSLAPERLWYRSYQHLLDDLRARGAWFATAGQVVAWFDKRRSVIFKPENTGAERCESNLNVDDESGRLPRLQFCTYGQQSQSYPSSSRRFLAASRVSPCRYVNGD